LITSLLFQKRNGGTGAHSAGEGWRQNQNPHPVWLQSPENLSLPSVAPHPTDLLEPRVSTDTKDLNKKDCVPDLGQFVHLFGSLMTAFGSYS